jgi:S-adenosylmethionine-diacylgycerolhomoserine-N-methlytransferase
MSLLAELKTLYHLALRPVRGRTHADRLESFYAGQAAQYDQFRRRLLRGRQELWSQLSPFAQGAVWVDLGGGTGANLEYFGESILRLSRIYVVDLSPSLLAVARQRVRDMRWQNVEIVEADATTFQPSEGHVDIVTFSYSLTMIPDWFAALENAWHLLKKGGHIGVVDFYVSRKHAVAGRVRHGWLTRHGWPLWFAADNVFLSPDHVPYLHRHFVAQHFAECRAKVPYLPWVRVPYYIFVGRK